MAARNIKAEVRTTEVEAASQLKGAARGFRLRSVALPAEHGGWSLLLEPIALGLLLAPAIPGLFLSLAAVGAFLTRHPFKLAVGAWRRKRRSARTVVAERFALVYLCVAIFGLAFAIDTGGSSLLLPLLLALPIAIVQLVYDATGRSRALIPELAGSIAAAAVATAIAMTGGAARPVAFGLWVIVVARTVPTILYIRARLRMLHGKEASSTGVIVVHALAVLVVTGLTSLQLAPVLAVVAMLVLLLRAMFGFSKIDRHVTAKKLGMREVAFGAITIFLVVLGFAGGR